MDFLELAKRRYSCRNFKPDEIEKDLWIKVLEAARIAPSAVNFQPWQFFVVLDPVQKAKVIESYPREWIKEAPALIIAAGDRQLSWKRADGKDHLEIDIAIAVDHLILQATALGLGTCWVCNFDRVKLHKTLNLPSHMEPLVIIPLGYPVNEADTERHAVKRKNLKAIVTWGIPG
jgi:nitroreductase